MLNSPPLQASDVQVLPDPARRWLAKPPGASWWPASEAQAKALDCPADILLMGGSLGSLKTSTMLIDLIQERDSPSMRSYFFRRTYSEMEGGDGAIDQSQRLFRDAVTQLMLQTGAKATYNGSLHTWTWPSGAEFYFRHAQHEKDIYQYQGHAMSALGIDEVTHWPEKMVKYLVTRNRCTDPNMTVRVRFGTNPGNVGNKWCKHVFFGGVCPHCHPEKAPASGVPRFDATWLDGQPLSITLESGHTVKLSVAYVLSSVREHSLYPPEYLARIKMQSPATAKALLEGCWDIFEGQFFDVFEPDRGIRLEDPRPGTGPMVMPRRDIGEQWWWPRWLASDFGFSISVSAAHLLIHQPQSKDWPRGRVFIADELDCQETAKNFANLLLKRWVLGDDGKPIEQRWMPWYLSPDSFREIGIGFTLAAQMNETLRPYGVQFQKADNDRVGGAMKMYTGFETGELVICSECPKLIAAIQSRVHDDKNENDVKKIPGEADDDYYDSCIAEGSLVTTERGDVPIELVSAGDRVWTRAGLRTVEWAGLTGTNKATVELRTHAGRRLRLTPDHVIWADRTWKSVDSANYADYLEAWPIAKKSSLMARLTGATQTTKTITSGIIFAGTKSLRRCTRSIATFGRAFTVRCQSGWSFTTKMATALTTSHQILNSETLLSTCGTTMHYDGPSSQRSRGAISRQLSLGIAREPEGRGIVKALSQTINPGSCMTEHPGSSNARIAVASFMRWLSERIASARMLATQPFVESPDSTTSLASVQCAEKVFAPTASNRLRLVGDYVERVVESKTTNVYDLSVESDHEYFANGILVHNCRYGYKSWETSRGVSTPLAIRLAERLGKEFEADPTSAMFNAAKTVEQEKSKEQPSFYGGSARARILQAERNRKRGL